VYRSPTWRGTIIGLRLAIDNAAAGEIVIKSFHTACDTRHNINNLNFIRGCHDYFVWTRDIGFLRSQIGRIRTAMRFVEQEFQTRERKCIYTSWPGHEGRSGVRWIDGVKTIVPGEGIGSNYWDLLPFGGEDALATVYYYDTLLDLAELEEAIAAHPEWAVSSMDRYDPSELRSHAKEVKAFAAERFCLARRPADRGRRYGHGSRRLSLALRTAIHDQAKRRLLRVELVSAGVGPLGLSGARRRGRARLVILRLNGPADHLRPR
jgi:hypothetical protein